MTGALGWLDCHAQPRGASRGQFDQTVGGPGGDTAQ